MLGLLRVVLIGSLVGLLGACGDDSSELTGTGTEPDETDGEDGPTESGGTTDGNGDSGAAGDGGGLAPECQGIDCGNGVCELDVLGSPMCACNDGFADVGLRCLQCSAVSNAANVDVPVVDVEITVTIGGAEPPAVLYEAGEIVLHNRGTGDQVSMGLTSEGRLVQTVVPGNYDVVYRHREGGAEVPINRNARLDTMYIDDAAPIAIDIPVARVQGAFSVNGSPAPTTLYEQGEVRLVNPISGDLVPLGTTAAGGFDELVIPGSYEIRYHHLEGGQDVPINRDGKVESLVVNVPDGTAGRFDFVHDVDIPMVRIDADVLIGGSPPPAGLYESGALSLVNATTGEEIPVGLTSDQSFSANVIPGTYDLVYSRLEGGAEVPINARGIVDTQTVANGETFSWNANIQVARLAGSFTVSGGLPPLGESGTVSLVGRATGDLAVLGDIENGAYDQLVMAGTYDVVYSQKISRGQLPVNTAAVLQQRVIKGDEQLDVDVPVVTVSGPITVNGGAPPDSDYDDARIYLRNVDTGDSVLLGSTHDGQYSRPVIPALYDIVYVVETPGMLVPNNGEAIIGELDLTAGGASQAIDVPMAVVDGALSVAGGQPADGLSEVYLEDLQTGDLVWLTDTNRGSYARPIAAGTYGLFYRNVITAAGLPPNTDAGFACWTVSR